MAGSDVDVVTGAFGYTGSYITRRLLVMGRQVKTLTGHPDRPNPFGERVQAVPFHFEEPGKLVESLRGASTLYNTYWVRFSYGEITFERAVENTKALIGTAADAGIRRMVHISITHASEDSPLPYFRGKGAVETAIRQSGLSYAIIRPTVIFGHEDILINNIAWMLRRFPVFAVPGSGEYRLQPVFVEDVAEIAVDAGQREENQVLDAAGPEEYTFHQLVRAIAGAVRSRSRVIHLPPALALILSQGIGFATRDVVLTTDELRGLMANLLVSDAPPLGHTRLSDWLRENAATVGARYHSELRRHYRDEGRGHISRSRLR